jgi:hypothetical protein
MKIAYLFHGHMRSWDKCYQSFFDNVFSVATGDIYIHTWDRINSKYGSFWNENPNDELANEYEKISSTQINLDTIEKAYNPKHIIVERDTGIDLPLAKLPKNITNNSNISLAHIAVYNMVKAQSDVFNLSTMYGEYDVYFSLRPDLFFKSKFDTEYFLPTNNMKVPNTLNEHFVLDVYAFGDKNSMSIRANFVNNIYEYWYSKPNLYRYCIEHAATKYYNDNRIPIKKINLEWEFVRIF